MMIQTETANTKFSSPISIPISKYHAKFDSAEGAYKRIKLSHSSSAMLNMSYSSPVEGKNAENCKI